MAKDTNLTLRLEEETKQRWNDHADEYPQYGSVSHLVRDAVETRISEDEDDYSSEEVLFTILDSVNDVEQQIQEHKRLTENVKNIQSTSEEIDQAVADLKEHISNESNDQMTF